MISERFRQLAEAYGGEIGRWPVAERDAAALFLAQDPDLAGSILAENADLDLMLDSWRTSPASNALQAAILASAPPPRRRSGLVNWFWRAGAGAGLAAACAAGLVLGVALSDAAPLPPTDEAVSAALAGYEELSGYGVGEEA